MAWPRLVLLTLFTVATDCFLVSNLAPAVKNLRLRASSTHKCGTVYMQSNRKDGATEEQIKNAYATYEELMRTSNDGKGYWMDAPFQFFINIQQAFSRNFGSEAKANPLQFFNNDPKVVDLSNSPFKPLVSADDLLDEAPKSEQQPRMEPMMAEPVSKPKSKTLKKSSKVADKAPSQSSSSSPLNVSVITSF